MPETDLNTYSYWVVRYTPNLVRDEWLNVGVLLLDPGRGRFDARFIEESGEFGRVRKLHPNSDETVLRALERHFDTVVRGAENPSAYLAKLGDTLSNVVQLSPERGLLGSDFEGELERLYEQHVAPPRRMGVMNLIAERTRAWILSRTRGVFRAAGLLEKLEKRVKVEEFTFTGDPMKIDFAYRRNGTRGFVQALSLERDAPEAKVLAYTAERIRQRLPSIEFTAITEVAPAADNERHQFVYHSLDEQQIRIVPVEQLDPWVNNLRAQLLQ